MNEDQTARMVAAARQLQSQKDPQATMQAAVELVVDNISGCDAAAISIVERRGQLRTPAYTEELALSGDLLQYELHEGPCVEAVWEEPLVHCADLLTDDRWPSWAPRVVSDLGARSMMCFRLFTDDDTLGALNLYSRTPQAFDAEDRDAGLALSAHIAIAVSAAQTNDNLNTALDTRTLIGQATGILMERHQMEADRAFAVLARISSHHNLKLSAVAHHLVTTRELLGADEDT